MKKWMLWSVRVLVGSLTLTATVGCGTIKVSPETEGRIAEMLDDAIEAAIARGEVERGEGTPSPAVSNPPPVVVVDSPKPDDPPPVVVTSNEVLRSVRWHDRDGFPKIQFDAPEIERWPKAGEKRVCALLRINRKKVEWIASGRGWTTAHNAVTPGKYYRPELKSGDVVEITFTDIYGKNETNPKTLVWP